MRRLLRSLLIALVLLPTLAHAWWNEDWSHRSKVVLDTSEQGVRTQGAVSEIVVPLRLHSGNFDFASAREDGADLRIFAADDKTPLPFQVERFDSLNELALVWVRVPMVAPGSDQNIVYAYYGNAGAAAEPPASVWGAAERVVFHFGEKDAPAQDATGSGLQSAAPLALEANGLLGNAMVAGSQPVVLNSERLQFAAGSAMTFSLWIKPADVGGGVLYEHGPLQLRLASGALSLQVGANRVAGGEVKPGQWQAIAVVFEGGKASVFLDGAQVAQLDAALPQLPAELRLATGYTGLLDELQVVASARSTEYLRLVAAAAAAEGRLLRANIEAQGEEGGGGEHAGHFAILVDNLTLDAWIVIVILAVMFVIATWVMVAKQMLISRIQKANDEFMERFRNASDDRLLTIQRDDVMARSPLFTLYSAGVREIEKRFAARASVGAAGSLLLGGASIDAIKASVDADQVRENHRLNRFMVLLTIAISGGPFLGLLGTVVGVMITFAAIAAAGDVNVNAIAPGIAAALLATVAGLAVAIPALFGYNWLASQIKNLTSDMQIFVDEFVTRVAEKYGD